MARVKDVKTLKKGSLLGHGWQELQSQRLPKWLVFQQEQ
uniref:Uncharacterized protein n=1 Tax=Anguilla anguilla TaxID=7936 RepID=A0A0E9SNY9_ANGAN